MNCAVEYVKATKNISTEAVEIQLRTVKNSTFINQEQVKISH